MAVKFDYLLGKLRESDSGGSGDVVGPASATDGDFARFDGTTGKLLKDGIALTTSLGSPGSDENVPSEKAVRAAISGAGGGDVSGPASAVDENITVFDSTTGKLIKDSGTNISAVTDNTTHTGLTNNPHSVTFTQTGAIEDTTDVIKDTHIDWGTGANQVSAVDMPILDDGSHFTGEEVETALQEVGKETTYADSPGVMTGGEISVGTNGRTFKVAALTAYLRSVNSLTAPLVYVTLEEQDNQPITAPNTTYFICLDYNSGSPQIVLSTTNPYGRTISPDRTQIPIGKVMEDGSNVHFISGGFNLQDGVMKLHQRAGTLRSKELTSGSTIAYSGTNNFTMSAGIVYAGINRVTLSSYDSAITQFTPIYRDGSGGWIEGAPRNTIDYAHYDDGDGTLGNVGVSKYGCHWVYKHVDDDHVYVVYGRGSYKLAEAELQGEPSKPDHLTDFGCLIGKIIAPQSGGSFIIQMVTDTFFVGTSVSDHGHLGGLDGDDHPQYLLASDATDRATFATNWTDLTDGGDTTLHDHDGISENTSARHTQGTDTTLGTMTADIDMDSSYQIVNLQAPAANGEAIRQTAKITEANMEAAHDHVDSDGSSHSKVTANETAIGLNTTHRGLTNNPHTVTATQVGLGNVTNVATDDTAYDATSWDANTDSATKNAIRDKIETMDTAIGLNTDKVTNATHTGDVTGATELTIGANKVNDTHIDWGTGANQVSAADIPIADAGSKITATDVEGALQENRTAIDLNTAKETNVSTSLEAGTVTATTYGITSDGGANDIVLPEADTNNAGLLGADKWDEIVANTAHSGGDGSDHADVATNTTAIALNTTHRGSDGSDHSKVTANETAIALNTTHRGSSGADHSYIDQDVTSGASPAFANPTITGATLNGTIAYGDNAPNISPKARAYLSAAQSNLSNNTWTKILLNTESYDAGSDFDTTNNRFVAPVTGYYLVSGMVRFENVVADKRYLASIFVNGGNYTSNSVHASTTVALAVPVTVIAPVTAGQYIELYAYQSSGVSTVDVGGGAANTSMVVHLLSV